MQATDKIMQSTLLHVARVQPGYPSRSGLCHVAGGTYRLIQARDVATTAGIMVGGAICIHPESAPDRYRISDGDILVAARGKDHWVHLVSGVPDNVLASTVFYIIRPNQALVLPGYLSWWLNQPGSQALLATATRGTGIGYLSRESVETLPIALPPLKVQRRITRVADLWRRQRTIQARLDERRDLLIQSLCRQVVNIGKDAAS